MSLRNCFALPPVLPVNHLQPQEAPMKRFLRYKIFLTTVLWIHWLLCCSQCFFLFGTSREGRRSGLTQPKGQSEAQWWGIVSIITQSVGGGTVIWLHSLCSLDSVFPLLIPLSGFTLRFISIDFPANTLYHFCIDCTDQVDVVTHSVAVLLTKVGSVPSDVDVRETHLFQER